MSKKESAWKKFIMLGPATIVSVAYIDPGNFGSNIEAGASFGLSLLWVVWLSSFMAMLFQYLAGKLGIATKKSLLELADQRLKGIARIAYFIPNIMLVFATDMAEFLGIVLGLSFLFGIPIELSIPIGIIDVFVLMFASDRKEIFELVIGSLVAIVGLSYLLELYIVKANVAEVLYKSFIPSLSGYNDALVAISIIGATIMPHAIILHSYLTKEDNGMSIHRHRVETITNLTIAALINVAIQVLAYYSYYGKVENVDMNIAYYTLIPLYGVSAALIFAIALLASGISSSMVSVMAGQKIFETAFRRKFKAWHTRAVVRLINIVPLAFALSLGIRAIDILIYSQAALSIILPVILFTLVYMTNNKRIMQGFKNSMSVSLVSYTATLIITAFNLLFIALSF
ncbi:MAG TPA: Nramp family divalent metal transporter [Geobacterales bacterium]|nr:Nramp family divalent metal transporter [Geobacterales bacterium]